MMSWCSDIILMSGTFNINTLLLKKSIVDNLSSKCPDFSKLLSCIFSCKHYALLTIYWRSWNVWVGRYDQYGRYFGSEISISVMVISTHLYSIHVRGGSMSPWPISITILIFLTEDIGDIDILYCSALWPTHIQYFIIAGKVSMTSMLFLNFRFRLIDTYIAKQVYRRRYESRCSSKPKLELLHPAMYHDRDIDFAR